ncbi:uncharacterized protein LOC133124660 isoform X2 [Conger conger]|uniref:uncharacterized protein LOC133124660 isoform X2 n=1 Tax=Conger conger TaxID=82655 RepID=UPI002A5A117D|nr:uncharacterized protein LOC133124660 isoform X2 [Conger conger]
MPPRLVLLCLFLSPAVQCTLLAPLNVTIVSFNLEHILHWLPAPGTPVTTHFRVHFLHLSEVSWKPVPWCLKVDMQTLSCDVTDSFSQPSSFYMARVQAFGSAQRSNWTLSTSFIPIMDIQPESLLFKGVSGGAPGARRGVLHHRCRDGELQHPCPALSATVCLHQPPAIQHSFLSCGLLLMPIAVYALLTALSVACLLGVLFCGFFLSSRSAKTLPEILLSIPSLVQNLRTAAPEPFSLATILPLEAPNFPSPWAPLGPNADQEEEEEEEEEEGYGRMDWEAT